MFDSQPWNKGLENKLNVSTWKLKHCRKIGSVLCNFEVKILPLQIYVDKLVLKFAIFKKTLI